MSDCKPQAGFQEVYTDWCGTHDVLLLECQSKSLRAALGEREKAIRDAMKWAGIGGLMREKVMIRLAALSAPGGVGE